MMEPGAGAAAVLEAIAEPALLLDGEDILVAANRRGLALLPPGAVGHPLRDLLAGAPEELDRYLRRCRGADAGLVGALLLRRPEAPERYRCRGAPVRLPAGAGLLLTLDRGGEGRFVALTRKVVELDGEVRERRHAEAVLAEALRERDLLLRELQHRVKNNVQMLAGLLQGAQRETSNLEAMAILRDVSLRFAAVGAVQQLIYGSRSLDTIDSREMIGMVARGATTLAEVEVELAVEAEPVALPIEAAAPLALILNELVTNSVKHGVPSTGRPAIRVTWRAEADHLVLLVEDNGPGLGPAEGPRRASGLGLVRGLLRQLGGSLTIESNAADGARGARCTVRVPVPRPSPGGGDTT
jgi:two-component sensor histidine kinase